MSYLVRGGIESVNETRKWNKGEERGERHVTGRSDWKRRGFRTCGTRASRN